MKNVVFIPNISLNNGRSKGYHYSIKSWSKWCKLNDIELFEWTEPIADPESLKITLQRYWVHDILEYNNINYDQVLIVDADTIIHPSTPNFFLETENKFSVVVNNGCYEWVTRSIREWGTNLFPEEEYIKPWNYFNGGFQITNKLHKHFYKQVQNFYLENSILISKLSGIIKAGTDQTIINYLSKIHNVEKKLLPECYNLQDLFRKNLLHIPGHSWFEDNLNFINAGWIYHFNAIPSNPRDTFYWMERTYKHLFNETENNQY